MTFFNSLPSHLKNRATSNTKVNEVPNKLGEKATIYLKGDQYTINDKI